MSRGGLRGRSSQVPLLPAPAAPKVDFDEETLTRLLPPYHVVLHNDDHNSMEHVVQALMRVLSVGRERAEQLMLQAHLHGQVIVITCPKEVAEHYREQLESYGLTATIEKAE